MAQVQALGQRAFDFSTDTFSFPNELFWEYRFDEKTGRTTTEKRVPPPTYAHHCFVVVRAVRQFFHHAEFIETAGKLEHAAYRQRIRAVVSRSDFAPSEAGTGIPFPGFANLRQFSAAHPDLLRAHCGGAWRSYVQRGNWRMIFPFSRSGQLRVALHLERRAQAGCLPIIHVVTFPSLTINHTIMILNAEADTFQCYDPNICAEPVTLKFDRTRGSFIFPRTHYFLGGPVNVYEIYRSRWI